METNLTCIPCIIRFALDMVRRVTNQPETQQAIMRQMLEALGNADWQLSPPELSYLVFKFIKKRLGPVDPYAEDKIRFNQFCLNLLPQLRQEVKQAADPFERALRLAIAGNIIDLSAIETLTENQVLDTISECRKAPLFYPEYVQQLKNDILAANRILILGDNAGEQVFDQLFIEQLPRENVTYVVKGAPILNDATMEDAVSTGLDQYVRVINNGSEMPGTILSSCSDSFRQEFQSADVIIAKGQANFETLSQQSRPIYFLLKIKCPVIGQNLGLAPGSCVIYQKGP
jgi:uncharacterized protein with ATP-grasp and redox domains